MLDVGWQYPPKWIFDQPHSRFVSQYGQTYNGGSKSGANGVNAVFSQTMRDRQGDYLARVLKAFGDSVQGLRLGGGYYGELCYPVADYGKRTNCY